MNTKAHAARLAHEIMTPEPVCAELGMTVREVAAIFDENEISGAPVIDGAGRLVGVVSRTDLVRRYTEGDIDHDPSMLIELFAGADDDEEIGPMSDRLIVVDDFMSVDPITAARTTPIHELAHRMVEARVHRVIIVDSENIPIGIVTSLDLVKALATA